jgi:nucleotide-binding universal stress UspA family protein
MSKTILVPVDGSEHSKKALEFAAELCSRFDGRLSLLHIPQSLPHDRTLILGAAAITMHSTGDELAAAGSKVLDAAKQLAAGHGCRQVEAQSVAGDPAQAIVKQAERIGADMIVMGSRGLSDIKGLLLGSVSHKVSHLAPCTCITVR